MLVVCRMSTGPGQSLTNPYTAIVTLFARLARKHRPLEVYEDGRIMRDSVLIDDVVDAVLATVQRLATQPRSLDIGYRYPEDDSERVIDHRPQQLETQPAMIAAMARAALGTLSAMRAALVVRSFQIGCY